MFNSMHRFYCPHCKIYVVGKTLSSLCSNLNDHNQDEHTTTESTNWNTVGLQCSMHYEAPDEEWEAPLPGLARPNPELAGTPRNDYLVPYQSQRASGEWGTAKRPPFITADDLVFLAEQKVKW